MSYFIKLMNITWRVNQIKKIYLRIGVGVLRAEEGNMLGVFKLSSSVLLSVGSKDVLRSSAPERK